jgi:Transposase IS66 family
MPKLSDKEIKQRLIEGRNYKRLYFELKVKYDEQAKEIRQLKAENDALKQQLTDTTETLSAQIAELQTMVFGRKQKPRSGSHSNRPPTQPRDKDSYRRPKPDESEVTSTEHLPIHACNHCGGKLIDKEEHIRYVEDIVLAALNALDQFKTVEKQTIERGYCVPCGKWSSAKDLRGQAVTIGPHVRTLICYLITLRDHSYDQVIHILWDLYQFKITEGEITTILDARRLELLPEYEKLKEKIRAGPAVHMDESRWKIQAEHAGYAWSMSNPGSPDVVFKLADNRGGGNARDLLGENYQGVGITDRYKAYKHLFEVTREDGSIVSNHQICWAHLQRTAKDLTHLVCLSKAKQRHVTRFYTRLASIYAAIRQYQAEPFAASKREEQQATLLKQTIQLCRPSKQDPKKLADLKAGILEYQDCLFLCLTVDGIPADNNRVERDIKQLVIKRRKSLGSKTTKGARTLEVLLSVCLSLYNRDRDNFFPNFHALTA